MRILKRYNFTTIEWDEIIQLYLMFINGVYKNRRHRKYDRYDSDMIYTCQVHIYDMNNKQKCDLIKKSNVVIRLMEPTEEMMQLHNMIWKI